MRTMPPRWISIFRFVLVALIKVIVCECYLSEAQIKSPSLDSFEIDPAFRDIPRENKSLVRAACKERACLPFCCATGEFEVPPYNDCTLMKNKSAPRFPPLHDDLTKEARSEELRINDFYPFWWDPCNGSEVYDLNPEKPEDEFKLLANGSIYRTYSNDFRHYLNYCLFATNDTSYYKVRVCFDDDVRELNNYISIIEDSPTTKQYDNRDGKVSSTKQQYFIYSQIGRIISIPCLCVTFFVYSILPELRNMHGSTLRGYVGSLLMTYISLLIDQFADPDYTNPNVCKLLAYVLYFFSVASFFWLNVMCFDIWWTFRGFRLLRGSVKQQKLLIIYSAYAWGSSSLLTGICLIMEYLPYVPSNWTTPGFSKKSCWFQSNNAAGIYFYGPFTLAVICNITLFVSTAIKLMQHKKATAHHLKGMDSRRHDVNKRRFNVYLTLFVMMGINWAMDILSWILEEISPSALWILPDVVNSIQGVMIFAISVWTNKIKQLILKRLGCRERILTWANSTRSAYHSSTSRSCTCTAGAVTTVRRQDNKKLRYSEPMEMIPDENYCLQDKITTHYNHI